MIFSKLLRNLAIGAALVAAPAASFAQVILQVGIAPPALPVYAQPVIPGDGYIWTPGYWAYGPEGYYWVPGVWVEPPTVGFLWTPAYWGWDGGFYHFHEGYWGPHIGFYGGINYGFGYFGHGFEGGYWTGGHFFYNRAYGNYGGVHITNVYNRTVNVGVYNHVSFNGGRGGIQERPQPGEMAAMHEQHVGPTSNQAAFHNAAASNPAQRFSANGGHPGTMAAATTRSGFGSSNAGRGGNEARPGNAPGGAAAGRPGNAPGGAARPGGAPGEARPGNAAGAARPGNAPAARPAAPQSTTHVAPPPRPAAAPAARPAPAAARPAPAAARPAPAAHAAPARSAPAHGNPRR